MALAFCFADMLDTYKEHASFVYLLTCPTASVNVLKAVGTAVDTYLMVLDSHKWTAMPSMAARSRNRSSTSSEAAAASAPSDLPGAPTATDGPQGADPSTPPYALMEHAPVAIFVNGLLSAFNELRHCAPLSLAGPLASILQVRLG